MNYELLLHEIINIAKEMVKSGAEMDRVEDSIYRMVESYDVEHCSVFAIQSNIQVTIKPVGGNFITQIRRIHRPGFHYERLDYLNDLSRYICQNKPSVETIQEKLQEIMQRKPQPVYLRYLSAILGGIGFGVYFGCDFIDFIVGTIVCAVIVVYLGGWLEKRENNMVVYNFFVTFSGSATVFALARYGIGHHPDRIILGLNMVLISGLGITNGIRDLLNRSYISGFIHIMNSCLGAVAIACGTGVAMFLLEAKMYEMYIAPSILIQMIACGVGTLGFGLLFQATLKQSVWAGAGGIINFSCYLIVMYYTGNDFIAVMAGSMSVAIFAYIMSRAHRAPATIYLTTSIMPVIPGATLFYIMHGLVHSDYSMATQQTIKAVWTCMAIAFGFMIVELLTRYLRKRPIQRKK